jgi:hypothetical protein
VASAKRTRDIWHLDADAAPALAGLPGVAKFKRRLGSVDLPVNDQAAALTPLGLIPAVPLSRDRVQAVVWRIRSRTRNATVHGARSTCLI